MMDHRAEVDGLRALAVVPVILFHAGLGIFGGGFAGVDVFFVISGYLITCRLHADLVAGCFSLADFYERRARRILPALLAVVAASLPMAWLWLMPADLQAFARSVLAVLAFGSNLLFWREGGYFSGAAELKPLLHTWSLAVEEQFYLLFPPLLALAWRRWPSRVPLLVGGLSVLSLAGAQLATAVAPVAGYFLLPTRAWELGVGALAALWTRRPPAGVSGRLAAAARPALAMTGLAMILASMLLHSRYTAYPGLPALLPVSGTALVLVCASGGTLVGRLLGTRPLVAIGLVSYSAYLWHQLLLALARHRSLAELDTVQRWLLVGLTFVLAALTWRFIEQPCRDRRRIGSRGLVLGLLACTLGIGVAAAALLLGTAQAGDERLRVTDGRCNQAQGRCFELPGAAHKVALWGDSHADVIAQDLGALLNARGISLALQVRQSCPSIPDTVRDEVRRLGPTFASDCAAHNEAARAAIFGDGIRDLVLVNAFQWYLTARNADGGPILRDAVHADEPPGVFVPKRLAELVTLARQRGIRVLLVLPHPLQEKFEQQRKALHRGVALPAVFDMEGAAQARRTLLSALPPGTPGLVLVDPGALYCDADRCRPIDASGRLALHDGSHLAAGTARRLAQVVADLVAPVPPALPEGKPAPR